MKRHSLLAAAIASLVATSSCAAWAVAEEAAMPGKRYSIGDSGTTQTSAPLTASGVKAKTAAHTSATTTTSTSSLASELGPHHAQHHHAQDNCDACGYCDECEMGGLWFVEAEGLLWWRKSRAVVPLVTTSIPGTVQADAGVLGLGSTRVLFGGENVHEDPAVGGRISFGRFLNANQEVGVGVSAFGLEPEDIRFTADSSVGILAVPFFNAGLLTPAEGSLLLNYPAVRENGRADIRYQNDVFGGDAYLRKLLWAEPNFRIDVIGGYQYSRIDDDLTLNFNFDDVGGNENFDITDSFRARNEFHGGSVGVLFYVDHGRWTVKGIAKCGLGNMRQTIDITGQTVSTIGGISAAQPSGLFALPTNIGSFTNDEFGIIPEGKLNIGYRVTDHWTFSVGYSFMYWNDIATGGGAVDRNLNLTQVPGPPGAGTELVPLPPAFLNNTDFWVQGLNFSVEFAY